MQLARLAAPVVTALAVLWPAVAAAYPQFQLSTGNSRCSLCHISPAGGGLLNDYGRSEAGDTISRGGDGDLLHGLYEEPDWFKLGGDYRGVAIVKDQRPEPRFLAFPMQFDIYSLFQGGSLSFYSVVGMRGQARPPERTVVERLVSREHWVMWRPRTSGPYARAGRFFPVYGLRSQDHTTFVRRYLGFHSQEEPYGVSVGLVQDEWEAHVSAFTAAPQILGGVGPRSTGGAAYYERRLGEDDNATVGGQAKVTIDPMTTRTLVGGIGKLYLDGPSLLMMAELDLGVQTFDADAAPARTQWAGYLGVNYLPFTGLMVGAVAERFEEDMAVAGVYRDAYSMTVQYFPWAHVELMLLGKLELQGEYSEPSKLLMLQWHYYL